MADGDYTDLKLVGRFTGDGEQFQTFLVVNGQEISFLNLDVASYREKFDEARKAASSAAQDQPAQ